MTTADHQAAQPERALGLIKSGMPLRIGRSIGRTLYVQTGDEASKEDLLIGVMDSPELAALVVEAMNERGR